MPRCVCKYESWQHCNNIKDMLSLSISLVESTNHKRNKGIIKPISYKPKIPISKKPFLHNSNLLHNSLMDEFVQKV